jgi:hypothetical protein
LDNTHASQTNATIKNLIRNTKREREREKEKTKKTSLCEKRRKFFLTNLLGGKIALQILHLLPSN